MQRVDLHTHSYASDAFGHPGEIARVCKALGLAAFSLTDHDSLLGQDEARQAADEAGIEFVPGVEVTASVGNPSLASGKTVHILGFYYDTPPDLARLLDSGNGLLDRINPALEGLREEEGMGNAVEEFAEFLVAHYGDGETSRMPGIQRKALGEFLERKGRVDPTEGERQGVEPVEWRRQRVVEFLDAAATARPKNCPAGIEEACRALRAAGAVVVLAHPGQGSREPCEAERRRIHQWLDGFVDGVEVFHHRNSPAYREMLLEVARDRGRPYTGGSDCHNFANTERILNVGRDDDSVLAWNAGPAKTFGHISEAPARCLELLKQAKAGERVRP